MRLDLASNFISKFGVWLFLVIGLFRVSRCWPTGPSVLPSMEVKGTGPVSVGHWSGKWQCNVTRLVSAPDLFEFKLVPWHSEFPGHDYWFLRVRIRCPVSSVFICQVRSYYAIKVVRCKRETRTITQSSSSVSFAGEGRRREDKL